MSDFQGLMLETEGSDNRAGSLEGPSTDSESQSWSKYRAIPTRPYMDHHRHFTPTKVDIWMRRRRLQNAQHSNPEAALTCSIFAKEHLPELPTTEVSSEKRVQKQIYVEAIQFNV
ncbi:hypothetical protein EVAR_54536_1 [Eumeta japonica]|uniref:Uncharacterized protein n=1 Tax=Eumeta variegata TaxID=151549 RepID=A0A4C1ZY93_EUMVA|nr:hypothetical protein EVAR_54536_1 [Eumeta japonica]